MFRSLKFRYRIGLLVAVAGIALLVTTTVTLVLGRQGERELTAIETRYVPLLELDREIEKLFRSIPRTLRDASDAGEEAGIVKATASGELLVTRLEANAERIADNGGDAKSLRQTIEAVGANVVVIRPGALSNAQVQRQLREFCHAPASCPAEYEQWLG